MRCEKHAFSIPSDRRVYQHEKVDTEKIIQLNIFSKVDIGERFASSLLLTPSEEVELLQCLYRRCESVIRFRTLLTPSEGVGHSRIFLTPLEGVELLRCLRMLCLCPQ